MTPYLIENIRSGALLGIYRAPSGRKAIRGMLRDAGYSSRTGIRLAEDPDAMAALKVLREKGYTSDQVKTAYDELGTVPAECPVGPDLQATPVVAVETDDDGQLGWHWVTETGLEEAFMEADWSYLGDNCWRPPEPDAPLPELPVLRTVEVEGYYGDPRLMKLAPQAWGIVS